MTRSKNECGVWEATASARKTSPDEILPTYFRRKRLAFGTFGITCDALHRCAQHMHVRRQPTVAIARGRRVEPLAEVNSAGDHDDKEAKDAGQGDEAHERRHPQHYIERRGIERDEVDVVRCAGRAPQGKILTARIPGVLAPVASVLRACGHCPDHARSPRVVD